MSWFEELKKQINDSRLPSWVYLFVGLSIILGSWVRYANLWNQGYHYDTIVTQYEWARYAYQHGLIHLWQDYNKSLDYPPLNLIYLNGIQIIAQKFLDGSGLSFVLVLKSWYWISDILLAVLAWFAAGLLRLKLTHKILTVSALYIIPSFWVDSAIWGQGDTFHALLVLLSLCLFYSRFRYRGFLAGIVLALAVWFKLQAILVLPILLLFWAAHYRRELWLHWKWLILIAVSGIAILAFPVRLVNNQYYDHKGLWEGYQDFTEFQTPLSYATIAGIVAYLLILIGGFTVVAVKNHKKFLQIDQFLVGFLTLTAGIISIFGTLSPIRLIRVTVGASFSDGNGPTGAANALGIGHSLQKYTNYGLPYWIPNALIYLATAFFVGILFVFLRAVYRARRNDLGSLLLILSVFIIEFFTFSVSRVHSRYAHIGLVLFTLIAFKFPLRLRGWVGIILVHIGYIWNQAYVFPSDVNNLEPKWLLTFGGFGGSNIFFVILGFMIIGSLLLLSELLFQLKQDRFDSTASGQ